METKIEYIFKRTPTLFQCNSMYIDDISGKEISSIGFDPLNKEKAKSIAKRKLIKILKRKKII